MGNSNLIRRLKKRGLQLSEILVLLNYGEAILDKNYNFKNIKTVLNKKIRMFHNCVNPINVRSFTWIDVIRKFGLHPKCYLTGVEINYEDSRSYNFDHIIPRSKGGGYGFDNMGLCLQKANFAKSDLMLPEFLKLCEMILLNRGYRLELNSKAC